MSASLRLYRGWRGAAGPFGAFVPAAPFSALSRTADPPQPSVLSPAATLAQTLAEILSDSAEAQAVVGGQAAFVLDLPAYLSLAVGFYLQELGIAPVSLLAGYYQPHAILNGQLVFSSLLQYGPQLQLYQAESGYAFLLERERNLLVPDLSLLHYFDNRYLTGEAYFPPLSLLAAKGLSTLIDVRAADDALPADLAEFYQQAAAANLSVFQARLPLTNLPL